MRWYVDVSSIGDSSPDEKLCIEAKQWQSALQEARRVRGDSGPLSKFSIEVLDDGYRAVNPGLKMRYVVRPAPADTPLSADTRVRMSSHPPPAELGGALLAAGSIPPAAAEPSSRPVSSSAASSKPFAGESQLIRQRSEEPTKDNPIHYREVAYSVRPGLSREQVEKVLLVRFQEICAELERRPAGKFIQLAIFDHQFAKRPVRPPLATLAWKDWRGAPVLGFPAFGDAGPPVTMSPPPPNWSGTHVSLPGESAAHAAGAANAPGASQPKTEALAQSRPASVPPSSTEAVRVIRSVPVGPAPPVPAAMDAIPKAAKVPSLAEEPAPAAPVAPIVADAPAGEPSAPSEPVAPAKVEVSTPAAKLESAAPTSSASNGAPAASQPPPSRPAATTPAELGRRRRGEDLLGDLFEQMHELHFMRDIAAGSEFVLNVLRAVLPSEAVVVQVFDINSRQFVVVRTFPSNRKAILLRTPDDDELVRDVMRRGMSLRIDEAASDPRLSAGIWPILGVAPRVAMCGPVKQGGRYLGLIQLANPSGGTPFHESEANALDYICQQFADFVANRPVVLEKDTLLPPR